MPNRIIKESICTSDSIDELGWFEEVVFYRLIVNCDDYGRFDGRTAVIKNRLFPLKDSLTLKNVEAAINRLVRAGLVSRYQANGKSFLLLPTWNEHQSVRAKKSRYPEPEIICNHMKSGEGKCPRNPIQSESNSYSYADAETHARAGTQNAVKTTEGAPAPVEGKAFTAFWEVYPCKIGRDAAWEAWKQLRPDAAMVSEIMAGLDAWKASENWEEANGKFIPRAAKFLTEKHWQSPPPKKTYSKGGERQLDEYEIAAIQRLMSEDFSSDLDLLEVEI